MKILIYSDLHLEFADYCAPAADYDVVILAGDIHLGADGVHWARREFPDVPVIYICGNHEYYRGEIESVHQQLREAAAGSQVRFCENETVRIDDIRFICATLWTDFAVQGNKEINMIQAGGMMNDYRLIRFGGSVLQPYDTECFHQASRQFLASELSAGAEGVSKTVVVTHHAPSARSLVGKRVGDALCNAYASSLDWMMHEFAPDLWIHGHTHESVDYRIGETRVISNPRGYARKANAHGNRDFKPVCIIDL